MSNHQIRKESSGCADTPGFETAGVHCDIRGKRDGRLDFALVLSRQPCTAAGVFTRNALAAAPVRLCRETLAAGSSIHGLVVNSGNANACTGPQGYADTRKMQELAADVTGFSRDSLFVCSTGRIGKQLPMDQVGEGIQSAAQSLGSTPECGLSAAGAILTSDTRSKVCTIDVETPMGRVVLSGMAKGAGMIEPNMATMLAFLCTDAAIPAEALQAVLSEATDKTFNAITVDGDESTNDTVLALANGNSGIELAPGIPGWEDFAAAFTEACQDLAMKIVGDGEKITKVVEICIEDAATDGDARKAARAIANSLLVKSSWYGCDPNWGRIMDAIGYSGAETGEPDIQLWYRDAEGGEPVPVFKRGEVLEAHADEWKAIVSSDRFGIVASLGTGDSSCRIWSTDLTEGYVNFNKSE